MFGSTGFNKISGERDCTNQIVEYDLEKGSMVLRLAHHKPDKMFKGRSHVASVLIGRDFLCFGGLNSYGSCLNEVVVINLDTFEWKQLKVDNSKEGPGARHSTAVCLVAYQERKVLTLDQFSEVQWEHVQNQISHEGVYLFGGVKGEKPNYDVFD